MKSLAKCISLFAVMALISIFMATSAFAEDSYTGNVIPVMTSATTPSGKVTTSEQYPTTPAWKAFDGIKAYTKDGSYGAWGTTMTTGWLAYEFPQNKIISKYVIYLSPGGYEISGMPKSWTFQGSKDGVSWDILDTQSQISWKAGDTKAFIFSNSTPYKIYKINVTQNNGSGSNTVNLIIPELEMMEKIAPVSPPTNLTANAEDKNVKLTWSAPAESVTGYNIKRSTTTGGPYTTIASNVTGVTYSDTTVINGTTYYYVVSAVNGSSESANSNEVSAKPVDQEATLNLIIAEEKVKVGQEVVSTVSLKNVKDIYAEDFSVSFDKNLFDFIGFEEIPGYKVYNSPTANQNGVIRFIVASQGQTNGITGEKALLKLRFKAKAAGVGKVDALKCRIADTTKEFDLNNNACGEDSVLIEGIQDVNKTGEYTLLDLAIDAYYYGQLGSSVDPVKYNANQAGDEYVTNDDLVYIVNQMLANSNYTPNQ